MQIYLVGGAVRDQLLGIPPKDKDWVVVGATPEEMLNLGYTQVGGDFPVFLDPHTHQEFALARTERKQGHGYHGFSHCAAPDVTLEQDLLRRDLTINSMAQHESGEIIDPYGGQADLQARLLRHVSPAFSEDPLRVLRVARFAARLSPMGFKVADETLALMSELSASGELEFLPAERIWQETYRALSEPDPALYFTLLAACGALGTIAPMLTVLVKAQRHLAILKPSKRPEVRFTALMCGASQRLSIDEALTQLADSCERLRTPKKIRQLVNNSRIALPVLEQFAEQDAETRLSMLENAGLLRQPELVTDVVESCALVTSKVEPSIAKPLTKLLMQLKQIDPQPFLAQGLKGAEMGEAIRQQRLLLCAVY